MSTKHHSQARSVQSLVGALLIALPACSVRDDYYLPLDASVDGGADASGDAIDADPVQAAFDLGFVSQWRVDAIRHDGLPPTSSQTFNNWIRIVNRGEAPLDLSTARITGVVDDYADRFDEVVTWDAAANFMLEPGLSAGLLSAEASQLIVASGLMTEPAQDNAIALARMSVSDFANSGLWLVVHVEITVEIENARATLETVLLGSGANPLSPIPHMAGRVSSGPL